MICSTLSGKISIKHPELKVLLREDGLYLSPIRGYSTGYKTEKGYARCIISGRKFYVHKLVAEAFLGACPSDKTCDHINRNRFDNRIENLRYATQQEQLANTSRADECAKKYGVRWADDQSEYYHRKYIQNREAILAKRREQYKTKKKTP